MDQAQSAWFYEGYTLPEKCDFLTNVTWFWTCSESWMLTHPWDQMDCTWSAEVVAGWAISCMLVLTHCSKADHQPSGNVFMHISIPFFIPKPSAAMALGLSAHIRKEPGMLGGHQLPC